MVATVRYPCIKVHGKNLPFLLSDGKNILPALRVARYIPPVYVLHILLILLPA